METQQHSTPDFIGDVRTFMQIFGQALQVADRCCLPPQNVRDLRERLITGEKEEFMEAWVADDIVGIADALVDLIYVIVGTALAYGIPLELVWNEVQRSNMAKVWTKAECDTIGEDKIRLGWRAHMIQPGRTIADSVYYVHNQHGKVMKPPSWKEPDIRGIIDAATRQPEKEKTRQRIDRLARDEAKRSPPEGTTAAGTLQELWKIYNSGPSEYQKGSPPPSENDGPPPDYNVSGRDVKTGD